MLEQSLLSICCGMIMISSCSKEKLSKSELISTQTKILSTSKSTSASTISSLQTTLKLQWNAFSFKKRFTQEEAFNFKICS